MTTLDVRRARADDGPALGRLGAALLRAHHAFDRQRFLAPSDDPETGYAAFLGSQLAHPDMAIFVAERDGTVVGYVYAGLEPMSWKELRGPAGFVHDLLVDEGSRGLGVAGALLRAAFEWMRAQGAPRVLLWTADQNTDAYRLFARLGFRRTMIEMTKEL